MTHILDVGRIKDPVQEIRERRAVDGHNDVPWTDFDIDCLLERIDRDAADIEQYKSRLSIAEPIAHRALEPERAAERLRKDKAREREEREHAYGLRRCVTGGDGRP